MTGINEELIRACGEKIHYPLPDIAQPCEAPSYGSVLSWMKAAQARRVAFDFWARGNYTRRLLFNRSRQVAPLLVRVSSAAEMRWAHRRLALLGIPVEFIYAGPCQRGWVIDAFPPEGIPIDAGWGYLATAQDEKTLVFMGHAALLPEDVLNWLVTEVAEEFLCGDVFVAPAELVGIDSDASSAEIAKHTVLTGGAYLTATQADASTVLELGIPYVDKLSPTAFRSLMDDQGHHLQAFRAAFHQYATSRAENEAERLRVLHQLTSEIEELTRSSKHVAFRDAVVALGGTLALTSSVAAATSGDFSSILAVAGGAITSAAGVHQHLRNRCREFSRQIEASPYALFWKLGLTQPSHFEPARRVAVRSNVRVLPARFDRNSDHHWLCPPTPGMLLLAITETERGGPCQEMEKPSATE